jgi:hypothetical protein
LLVCPTCPLKARLDLAPLVNDFLLVGWSGDGVRCGFHGLSEAANSREAGWFNWRNG